MLKFIEKIRSEPESYRKKMTWIVSGSVTGIIFLAWLLYMSSGSFGYSAKTESEANSNSPIATLKEMTSQAASSIRELSDTIGQLRNALTASSSPDNMAVSTDSN